MEDNNKINLTIENYTGEKPIEVVYREGVAGKVLDQKAPEKIEKTTFDVEFDHYLTDGEVFLQLVSPGAKELTDQYCDKTIDAVLDKIRGVAPDIAIIEA